jgi:DUF971 family protein
MQGGFRIREKRNRDTFFSKRQERKGCVPFVMEASEKLRPVEIGRANEHDIKIRWNNGTQSVCMARRVRLACPCAGCVDETTGAQRLEPASVPGDVRPLGIELVGRYAIQVRWSDGHSTGLYSFDLLRRLAQPEDSEVPPGAGRRVERSGG